MTVKRSLSKARVTPLCYDTLLDVFLVVVIRSYSVGSNLSVISHSKLRGFLEGY